MISDESYKLLQYAHRLQGADDSILRQLVIDRLSNHENKSGLTVPLQLGKRIPFETWCSFWFTEIPLENQLRLASSTIIASLIVNRIDSWIDSDNGATPVSNKGYLAIWESDVYAFVGYKVDLDRTISRWSTSCGYSGEALKAGVLRKNPFYVLIGTAYSNGQTESQSRLIQLFAEGITSIYGLIDDTMDLLGDFRKGKDNAVINYFSELQGAECVDTLFATAIRRDVIGNIFNLVHNELSTLETLAREGRRGLLASYVKAILDSLADLRSIILGTWIVELGDGFKP